MKIYLLVTPTNKHRGDIIRAADFLSQRGHTIVNLDMISSKVTPTFEQQLAALHDSDWLIFQPENSSFSEGFFTAIATAKYKVKTLFLFQDDARNSVPEIVLNCTYPETYLKSYHTWQDLQNTLTLLKF